MSWKCRSYIGTITLHARAILSRFHGLLQDLKHIQRQVYYAGNACHGVTTISVRNWSDPGSPDVHSYNCSKGRLAQLPLRCKYLQGGWLLITDACEESRPDVPGRTTSPKRLKM